MHWDSPGKNTGVGCHFLLQCIKVKSESEGAQSVRLLATPWTAATRLLHPWDFLGKSTGVGCHCLLHLFLVPDELWKFSLWLMGRALHPSFLCCGAGFLSSTRVVLSRAVDGFFPCMWWLLFCSRLGQLWGSLASSLVWLCLLGLWIPVALVALFFQRRLLPSGRASGIAWDSSFNHKPPSQARP